MSDLFERDRPPAREPGRPLADRLRPSIETCSAELPSGARSSLILTLFSAPPLNTEKSAMLPICWVARR